MTEELQKASVSGSISAVTGILLQTKAFEEPEASLIGP